MFELLDQLSSEVNLYLDFFLIYINLNTIQVKLSKYFTIFDKKNYLKYNTERF